MSVCNGVEGRPPGAGSSPPAVSDANDTDERTLSSCSCSGMASLSASASPLSWEVCALAEAALAARRLDAEEPRPRLGSVGECEEVGADNEGGSTPAAAMAAAAAEEGGASAACEYVCECGVRSGL